MTHPTKNTVQAVSFDYEKVSWKVLDRSIQKDFDALSEVAAGDFSVASRTLDDKTWVVAYRSDVQPASYYLWDRKAKRATFLFSSRPALDGLPLAHMHPQLIPTLDGLTLVSYLTLPPASDPDGDAGRAIHPALEDLVLACLAKKPDQRPGAGRPAARPDLRRAVDRGRRPRLVGREPARGAGAAGRRGP